MKHFLRKIKTSALNCMNELQAAVDQCDAAEVAGYDLFEISLNLEKVRETTSMLVKRINDQVHDAEGDLP